MKWHMCMNRRELTSIIACLGGTSYWYLKISYLTYYYMFISYFLDSVVYYLVNRCLIPLIITSMILLLRKFHPRGEESSVMNYFIAFCANRKWYNLFDITHCDHGTIDQRLHNALTVYMTMALLSEVTYMSLLYIWPWHYWSEVS